MASRRSRIGSGRTFDRRGHVPADAEERRLPVRLGRGVHVVVQHPLRGRAAVGPGDAGVELFDGVGAQQVVHREPARAVFFDQVGVGQFPQRFGGRARVGRGEAGRRGRGDVGSGVEPQ
ncbi:hypothetical protein GCM10029992_66730 [Glycomyces albus]